MMPGNGSGSSSGSGLGSGSGSAVDPSVYIDVSAIDFGDPLNKDYQVMYRKSVEYRLAHGRMMRFNQLANDTISFLVLCLSTATGLLLFMGDFVTLSTVVAACITGLNAFSKFMDFSGLGERHALSMKEFGNLARDLLTLLSAASLEEQVHQLDDLNARFNDGVSAMPMLPYPALVGETDEKDKPIFVLITDPALLAEAAAGLLGGLAAGNKELLAMKDAADKAKEKAEGAVEGAQQRALAYKSQAEGAMDAANNAADSAYGAAQGYQQQAQEAIGNAQGAMGNAAVGVQQQLGEKKDEAKSWYTPW